MTDLTVAEAIREKREAIVRIAASHGAIQVRLIGSVARGDARPDSDVDLLVTWSEGTSLPDQAALMQVIGEAARSASIRTTNVHFLRTLQRFSAIGRRIFKLAA